MKPWRGQGIFSEEMRFALCVGLAAAVACTSRPPDPKSYLDTVAAARAAKDELFRTGSDSPIPPEQHADLLPLSYFPIDPDYNVAAFLKPSGDRTVIEMVTSTGGRSEMRRVGTLEFALRGQSLKLTAFVEASARDLNRLFVPFTDLTTGTETYPGGRYIDLDRNSSGLYMMDFNRAYHPYCYYNATWECPYPPAENRLQVPVRAGERLKHPNT